ncbi:IclR family transcriptional regulator [halophilic archaeon]|nr:IclR family transcriptional regulator [halophilic archaeon]
MVEETISLGMNESSEVRKISSVDTSCKILKTLQKQNGATVSAISESVGLSVGAVHTHLATLREHGLVAKMDQKYWLGPQLVPFGEYVKHQSDLYRASKKEIERVAEETGECVHLIVENNGQSIILYDSFGEDAVGTKFHSASREKPSNHLHYHAAGKAILAHLPSERIHQIIDEHGLEPMTKNTITDKETLFEQLSEIRSRGFAYNDEEELLGLRSVGVPIIANEELRGAISFSAPVSRLQDEYYHEEIPDLLKKSANIIEINLQTNDLSLE